MTHILRKFLSKVLIAAMAAVIITPAFGATNMPMGDVSDIGTWATDHNRELVVENISHDLTQFESGFPEQLTDNYVPIEARVGLAFMNALSFIGDLLDSSLVRFAIIFIILSYIFWIMLETYNMMTGDGNVRKLLESIVKKTIKIAAWTIILNFGPAQLFMWIAGPIISIGTYLSDLILNTITSSAGAQLPDTCAAIRDYAATHTSPDMIISARSAADIICVPTRLSGFFYTGIMAGFKWMIAGIGHSAFTFLAGAVMVVVFIINIWKFALMAIGVIADLFLSVLLLPFTAIAETIGKTSYKGIVGDIFNGFMGIFKLGAFSLDEQIKRFINAAIYFVSLSIVIAVCAAILSGAVSGDLAGNVPSINNSGFMITLLTGLLVAYLANRAGEIATDLGGSVDKSLGDKFGDDITSRAKKAYSTARDWIKIIRDGKK